MGDGIGHVAVTGVAIGLLTGTSPTWTAVVVAVLGAVLIEVIRERGHTNGDVALALLFYGGLAGGVLITGLAGQSAARLQEYLFGSITTISTGDVLVTLALTVVLLVTTLGLSPQLFAVAQRPGVRPGRRAAACAPTTCWSRCSPRSASRVAMRTVGLLLVSALMVVPVATVAAADPLVPHDARRARWSSASLASLGGLLLSAALSFRADGRPRPTIVLLALAGSPHLADRGAGCAGAAGCSRPSRASTAARPHDHRRAPPRARRGLRPPRGPARRPRRLRPRRPPARPPRRAL